MQDMARAPASASPPPADRPRIDAGAQPSRGEGADEACAPETYGPLRVEREVKEDGRTLILYAREGSAGA
jgi:hypothetical protein